MQVVRSREAKKINTAESTTIWEFDTRDISIGGAVAEIHGRYPEKGFAVNTISKEVAFVISGSGHVITPIDKRDIHVGDVIFINRDEKFAWEGTLSLFITTTPKFAGNQHKIIDKS